VDVRAVAVKYGGGGHTNAAGFTLRGPEDQVRAQVIDDVIEAIERAAAPPHQ
jgi:nanoRNase/pAp phosphatase (c-di-AMP/oligoRNAs hydrolase)